MKIISFPILLALAILLTSCPEPPSLSPVPEITFKSINKSQVKANVALDSLLIVFEFTDGDGDLGRDDSTVHDIFLDEMRGGALYDTLSYLLPYITPSTRNKSVTGEVTIIIPLHLCRPLPAGRLLDTTMYNIYIRDRAGHLSDTVSTPPVEIDCVP